MQLIVPLVEHGHRILHIFILQNCFRGRWAVVEVGAGNNWFWHH